MSSKKYLENLKEYKAILQNINFELRSTVKIDDNNKKIVVACILDEFSYNCFKDEGEFIYLTPQNWESEIANLKIDFLFVESVWTGLRDEWKFKFINMHELTSFKKANENYLNNILSWFKKNNIPTVFWNKEDPIHYDEFIYVAKKFDYVFTTDENIIPKYIEDCKHNRVFTLQFAANLKIHNPINKGKERLGEFAFAGSWYERHEERKKVTREILDIFSKYDLTIYDRHYNKDTNGRNTFPDKYKNYIKGGLPYSEMIKTYKKYDVFLNVNTVLNSPTMYSRRVFELLGCGTNVVTTESLGIAKDFENIVLRTNEDNFNLKIKSILNDKDLKDKNSLKGIREIVTKHTYQKRFDFIVKKLKIKNYRKENFNVSVIACTNRPEYIENIIKNYTTQKYANKELIIILNNNNINLLKVKERIENLSNIYIYKLDEKLTLGECINFGVEKSNSAYIAKFDDDDFYGENYLIDMIMPFRYSEADVVGKKSIYIYYEGSNTLELKYANTEYRYSDFISGATLVFKKTVFEKVQLESRNLGEDTAFINNCKLLGMKLYSADRFNYIAYRRIDKNSHTWKVSDEALKSKSEVIKNNISYEDSKEIVLV